MVRLLLDERQWKKLAAEYRRPACKDGRNFIEAVCGGAVQARPGVHANAMRVSDTHTVGSGRDRRGMAETADRERCRGQDCERGCLLAT